MMSLGFKILGLLRKGREALNFYHYTQSPDEANPISWDKEMYDVWFQINFEAVSCIRGFKSPAMNEIKEAIESEEAGVASKLSEKFILYQWSAIQVHTVEEKDNTDFFPKGQNSHILNHAQGNDKQLFAIYKPDSRSNFEQNVKEEVQRLVEEWCSEFSYEVSIKASYVIEGITKKLGRYKNNIRGMVAVYRKGEDGTSGNFDVNYSCRKPHYHWGNFAIMGATSMVPGWGQIAWKATAAGMHAAKGIDLQTMKDNELDR